MLNDTCNFTKVFAGIEGQKKNKFSWLIYCCFLTELSRRNLVKVKVILHPTTGIRQSVNNK